MPNTRETVRALISAFNIHNYARNTLETNFTLQSRCGEDCIVVSFDKAVDKGQWERYLNGIKRKIVGEFYGIEEGDTDEVVLNTAKLIFDVKSFPFNISKGFWSVGKNGGFEFAAPINQGVIFNLKSHLASSLKKDVLEDIRVSSATIAFKEKKYLWHDEFDNKELCKQFEREFLSRMRERYENVPKNPLKVEGNSVYIKDVFDDARFIDSVTRYKAWLTGMDLGVGNDVDRRVQLFRFMVIRSIYQMVKVTIDGFVSAPPLDRTEFSILTPIMQNGKGIELLTKENARAINHQFNNPVLSNINGRTQAELTIDGDSGIYGINFSDPEISHCVVTKIIESSVINAKHELSIDPELRLQALSPAQSPVRVPNGPSSGLTESSPTQQFPTRSQGEELEGSPRQGTETEKGLLSLHNSVSSAGTSREFLPSTQLSPTAVIHPGPSSSQSLSAARNLSAWTSQPIGACSSSAPSAGFSSWKGAAQNVQASTNPWCQPIGCLSLPVFYAQSSDISVPRFQPPTQRSSSGPIRLSIPIPRPQPYARPPSVHSADTGSRLQPYVRSPSVHSEDSGLGSSRSASTPSTEECNERSASVYSEDSGFESRPSSTFTDTSNYGNQKESTEKELIINKILKNVKEIAAKNIEEKKTLEKEKIHEYIEGFAKLEKADKLYQYCISFDEKYFKGKESCSKTVFDTFKDNYITALHSELTRCGLAPFDCRVDKLYIKDIIDINAIKKIAENARMPDGQSLPKWTQQRAKAGANKSRTSNQSTNKNVLTEEEEKLAQALLDVFNVCNYTLGEAYTNFTLEDGKIVSLLGDNVDKTEYLKKVRAHIIENDCGTEKVARKVYDLGRFPFVFPPDSQRNEDGKTIIARNIDDAIPNLKVYLIQKFRIQVEEEVAKKLEEMGVTEARERIKAVYLSEKGRNYSPWYVFLGDCFKGESDLFKKFESIYVEAFKSRWKECGLDDSLVYYKDGALHIKNSIDINVVKNIEEYEKKKYVEGQESSLSEETPVVDVPSKEEIVGNQIVYDEEGRYVLDHDFGSDEDMDCEKPLSELDRGNTGRKSQKRKSPSPSSEDEGSPESKSQKSGSGNSSSEEQPRSNLSDQLCEQLNETQIS